MCIGRLIHLLTLQRFKWHVAGTWCLLLVMLLISQSPRSCNTAFNIKRNPRCSSSNFHDVTLDWVKQTPKCRSSVCYFFHVDPLIWSWIRMKMNGSKIWIVKVIVQYRLHLFTITGYILETFLIICKNWVNLGATKNDFFKIKPCKRLVTQKMNWLPVYPV